MCARGMLLALGWWRVRTKDMATCYGRPQVELDDETPRHVAIIVSNHVSFVDILVLFCLHGCTAVGKDSILDAPLIGRMARAIQMIAVRRESPNSRKEIAAEIRRRAHHTPVEGRDTWRPLLIFPEATTNSRSLIQFKIGVFLPGVPVQPIVLRYPHRWLDVSWVGDMSAHVLLLLMMCQVYNSVEVAYLPLAVPTAAEERDPVVFAQRVRQCMASFLGVPTTEHNFDDVLLLAEAALLRLLLDELNVGMGAVTGIAFPTVQPSHDTNGDGLLDRDEFGCFMGLSDAATRPLRDRLFDAWDTDRSGRMNFRVFLMNTLAHRTVLQQQLRGAAAPSSNVTFVSNFSPPPTNNDDVDDAELRLCVELCFLAFGSVSGSLTLEQWLTGFGAAWPHEVESLTELFRRVDANGNGHVELDEFVAFACVHRSFADELLCVMATNGQKKQSDC